MKLGTWFVALAGLVAAPKSSFSILAFDDGGLQKSFVYRVGNKVTYRKCRTEALTRSLVAQFEKKLKPQCDSDPNKLTYESDTLSYYRSVAAMYGVPTESLKGNTPEEVVTEIAIRAELAHRDSGEDSPLLSSSTNRMIAALESVLEALEPDKHRVLYKGENEYDSMSVVSLRSITPIFSDGTLTLLSGYRANPNTLMSACPAGWGTMSAITALQLLGSNGHAFIHWYTKTPAGRVNPTVLTWNDYRETKSSRNGSMGQIFSSHKMTMALSPQTLQWAQAQPHGWYMSLQPMVSTALLPGYKNQIFGMTPGNGEHAILCLRRELPNFHQAKPWGVPGHITIDILAQRYSMSASAFYSKILVNPDIEKALSPFFIYAEPMTEQIWRDTAQRAVEDLLVSNLPDYHQLEKDSIEREKWEAQRRAREAEEQRQNEIRWAEERRQQKIRDQQYQELQRQQAEAEERARNSTPLYARRTKTDVYRRTYYDNNNNPITKAGHDVQMNRYNEWKYGRRLYDASGNAVSYEDYLDLNR